MTNLETVVAQLAAADGGVVSRRMLITCDVVAADVEYAVRHRYLEVIRRGWYKTGSADPTVLAAVRSGGVLSCVTALAAYDGIWGVPTDRIHVRRSRHLKRGRLDRGCAAYSTLATPIRAIDAVPEALACAARCAEPEDFVAICDSLLRHRPGWRSSDLPPILGGAPQRVLGLLDDLDARADSGIESLVRFRLRRHGIRLRTQVFIADVGTVDLLVGDRLIIECDGKEFHVGRQFTKDRWRDLVSVADGYVVMRLTYPNVIYQWDEVFPYIRRVIRSRRHLDRSAKLPHIA